MNDNTKKILLDFLEAMTQAFHYIEHGCDYFSVKAGAVEVKVDAMSEKVILDDGNEKG